MIKSEDEIIAHNSSPLLVKAGPGSGKTTLLAKKIKFLLDKERADKNTITVLTYNKDTMRHLVSILVDKNLDYHIRPQDLPNITTMHALGHGIIKENPRKIGLCKENLDVQDDENVTRLIFRDAALMLDYSEEDGRAARKCKQKGDCKPGATSKECRICEEYWKIMAVFNQVDFDDQILFACRVLEENQDILAKYQSKANYLLIDEYQDINAAQFRLISLLSEKSRNGLFVVGDDAQTIYAFRGSNPKFILRFKKDFPGAESPLWPYSHRCHEKTMADACKVLEKYYKEWDRPALEYDTKDGEQPDIWQLRSELEEAKWVARGARKFNHEKKSVLILAPKKELFILVAKELKNLDVPFTGQENLFPKYLNDHINSIESFLKWIAKPHDSFLTRLVIEELLNRGSAKVPGAKKLRGLRPETKEKRISAEKEVATLWRLVTKKEDLFTVLDRVGEKSTVLNAINKILQSLAKSYERIKDNKNEEFINHLFIQSGIWGKSSTLARDLSLIINVLRLKRPTGISRVQLMTMRKAKGLEAEIVIIIGLEDDIFPDPDRDIVEEARLFYVSITRAKNRVYLFHSGRRPRDISYGSEILSKRRSRFLDDIGRQSKHQGIGREKQSIETKA